MKGFGTVLKLLFSYMFKRDKSKKSSKWMWLAYTVLAIFVGFIAVGLILMVWGMSKSFATLELVPEFLTILYSISAVVILIFGTASMLSNMYFSKDSEFFLGLPIKPSTIYFAKLAVIYCMELIISTFILLPSLITVGVVLKMSALYYIIMVFGIFFVPALPLLLASVLAIPLMYVVSFFKNRGALASIALILLFGLFFGVYYFGVTRFATMFENHVDIEALVLQMQKGMRILSNILFPISSIARLSVLATIGNLSVVASAFANLAIFIGSMAVLILLTLLISSTVYRRGVSGQLEGARRTTKTEVKYSASKPVQALMKREWRDLIRTPAYAFQCLSGIVLCPILMGFMLFGFGSGMGLNAAGLNLGALVWFIGIGIISTMGVSMNLGASTSITREGSMFYYSKIIPVDYTTQIKAKSIFYNFIAIITILVSMIFLSIVDFNLLYLVLGLGFLLIYNYGYVNFAIFFDLCRPKLDWVTPTEAVKQNRNAIIPMLINMGMSILFMIAPVFCIVAIPNLIVGTVVAWLILYAIAITVAVVFHCLLYANCDRLYKRL